MNKKKGLIFNFIVMLSMLSGMVTTPALAAFQPDQPAAAQPQAQAASQPALQEILAPVVLGPFAALDNSVEAPAPTRDPFVETKTSPYRELRDRLFMPKTLRGAAESGVDEAMQKFYGLDAMPAPIVNFEGVDNIDGVYPPDTDGEAGPNHYIQMVNLHTAIYDKSGTLLYGPFLPGDLWPSGDVCRLNNDGDVVTLYDQLSDRWILSQFALPNFPSGPYYECIAVSKTGNPTNVPADWWVYSILASNTKMNDYPKLSVWPDAYYMTANQFTGGASWGGAGVWALDSAAMQNGQAVTIVYFDLEPADPNFGGMLPVDMDGSTPPPAGSPGFFVEVDDSTWIAPNDALRIWEFHVNWANPGASTFGLAGQPNFILNTANWTPSRCASRSCVPQPGTSQGLDDIGDRLMFRAAYRNFGGHESLVLNHTVEADASGRFGVRWYEVRDLNSSPYIYQQGTFGPADTEWRWMASIAQDHVGNIAVGYSVSSSTVFPSIRYTGRLASDPLGTMPQGEAEVIAGSGVQTGTQGRWGDYSAMSVDPVDDCTFWYTQEYIQTTGTANWQTRVASFKFPNCSLGPTGTLAGVVSDALSSAGVANATVQATLSPTLTFGTTTAGDGSYQFTLPTGTYTVTASAFAYLPATVTGVDVLQNVTTTLDIPLTPAQLYTVSGVVSDLNAGWPLYAMIDIDGYPGSAFWTDPATGAYSIDLPAGMAFTFNVSAFSSGYNPTSLVVGPLAGNATVDIQLDVDANNCVAPGYNLRVVGVYETFDATTAPPGWSTVNNGGACTWAFNNPGGRANLTGGAGNFAVADSDACGSGTTMNTDLFSPIMDVSALPNLTLEFMYDYNNLSSSEVAAVDVSSDGGASWTNLVSWNTDQRGPATYTQDVTSLLGGSTQAQVRWRYVAPGWDWWWEVDDVFMGAKYCEPMPGGLTVGSVADANTMSGLVGADVTNPLYATQTVATPLDPAVDDGFYTLFAPAGTHVYTASLNLYAPATASVTVLLSDTVRQDFALDAGWLSYTPPAIDVSIPAGMTATVPLDLSNQGNASASFEFFELDKGSVPFGPFQQPSGVVKPFKQELPDALTLGLPPSDPGTPLAAGDIIQTWPAGWGTAWGVAYDSDNGTVWVSDGWGSNDYVKEFAPDGTPTGRQWSYNWTTTSGPADAAFNWNTGKLWLMNVNTGVSNCIYEVDPASGPTGNTICPGGGTGFSISQRGIAYDPSTDTYFAGGWNDLTIFRFDSAGTILSSVVVNLAIAGLAYNPDTQHLFVIDSATTSRVYVLDVANNYNQIGSFTISGFGGGGAGLEIDCDGTLWAVNQTSTTADTIYQVESGETASFCGGDVPWLSVDPITGTVSAMSSQMIDVNLDAGAVQPGIYNAQLKIDNDTPYNVPNLPVRMTVTVPPDWGKLEGSVESLGYCDTNPFFVPDLPVLIESSGGMTWTVTTDANGYYSLWLPAASSPLTVTVSAPNHTSGFASGVMVFPQTSTTQHFSLRLLEPCLSASPGSMTVNLNLGTQTNRLLRLNNDGADTGVYTMTEKLVSQPYLPSPSAPAGAQRVELSLSSSPNVSGAPAQPWNPSGPVQLVVDDGTAEDSIGLSAGGQFIWLNRFTPNPADFPFVLDQISLLMNNSTPVGAALQLLVYEDTDGDGNPGTGATFLYSENVTVQNNNLTTWNVYNLATPVQLNGPGDVLIGVVNRSGAAGILDYPAAIDTGASQVRSWIGEYGGVNPPNPPPLPAPALWGTIDSFGFPGNWTLRGSGFTGSAGVVTDVPWLTENPMQGTVAADSYAFNTVGFDANDVPVPGTYEATVVVNNNDTNNNPIEVAVTMNVSAPASWGILTGNAQSQGYCDVNPSPAPGVYLVLENSLGITRTVTTDQNGDYTIWLDSSKNPHTLFASEPAHVPTMIAGLNVPGTGGSLTQDLSLRLNVPCLGLAPTSFDVTLPWGATLVQTMTLSNSGAASALYTVTEQAGGFTPLLPQIGEDFLVVNDGCTNCAIAVETALTNLGYTYLRILSSAFTTTPIPDLLTYKAVLYVGPPSVGAERNQVIAFLDAGGKLMIADNDFGLFADGQPVYATYLQADYLADSGSDGPITGTDIMAGINTDISSDPFPDSFQIIGPDAVGIFLNTAPRANLAGLRIARNTYKAVYLAWDFQYAGGSTIGDPVETDILRQVLGWLNPVGDALPWLSESPDTGSVAGDGGVQDVLLTFDASVPEVDQPGTYDGVLQVANEDANFGTVSVPVVMHVMPAVTSGKLNGSVSGLGYCDINPAPLDGADVTIEDSLGGSWALTTDPAGYYQRWLDAGVYTVTASMAGHVTDFAVATVTAGVTTTQDINLRWLQPCVTAVPAGLHATLDLGLTTTLTTTLYNTGAAGTGFSLFETSGGFLPVAPQPNLAGGPDPFGYTFKDSNEVGGPSYGWIDASGGTLLTYTSDDGEANITLPFPFTFYGVTSTNLRIGKNGGLLFNATTGDVGFSNLVMNSASTPNNFMAFMWDDQGLGGSVYWQVFGTAPNRMVVIEFLDVPRYVAVGAASYEVILLENGSILYQYLDVDYGDATYNNGASATIGIRGPDAANSLQYSFNQAVIQDGMAICFAAPGWAGDCSFNTAIPWADEAPTIGSLVADTGMQDIAVSFDAGVPEIDQPGVYYGTVNARTADPVDPVLQIPITLTVNIPATWGKLNGTVSSLGACDVNPAALFGASVYVESHTGMTYTLSSDAAGYFQLWGVQGAYTVTVSAAEHVTALPVVYNVTAGATTTQDVNLRWLKPCVSTTPTEMQATVTWPGSDTQQLTLHNSGAGATLFEITKNPRGFIPVAPVGGQASNPPVTGTPEQVAELAGAGVPAQAAQPSAIGQRSSPYVPANVLYDNGPLVTHPGGGTSGADASAVQTALGMTTYGLGHQFTAGYRVADDFIVTGGGWDLDQITFFAYQTGSSTASTITGLYLQIWDGVPDQPGSNVVFGDLTTNRLINTTWSGIYRVLDTGLLDTTRPIMANTASVDVDLPAGTYWIDWMTDGTLASGPWAPPISILGQTTTGNALQYTGTWAPANDGGTLTQQGFPFIIEGGGAGPGADWIIVTPLTGTLSGDSQFVLDVTFDSSAVDQPGIYFGSVDLSTDDVLNPVVSVPVTMTVDAPANWGKMFGTVSGLGYCDANPYVVEGATVFMEMSNGMTVTLTTDAAGYYQHWMPVSFGPMTMTVSADADHTVSFETGIAMGPQVQHDVNLRWLKPCVTADPGAFDIKLVLGYATTVPITLTDLGAAGTDFAFYEAAMGFTPTLQAVPAEGFQIVSESLPKEAESAESGASDQLLGGGPDPFGYEYKDSNEAGGPQYAWVDISTTGASIALGDDSFAGPVSIGFPFNFYGLDYTELFVGSNGFLSFGSGSTDLGNDPIPTAGTPNDIIALMWDDLDPGDTSDLVYYESFASCPYQSGACMVVQYENYHHYPGGGTIAGTFQAILFESGNILMQFLDAGAEMGSGATTGIENVDGTIGLQYGYNTTYLSDDLAVCFAYPGNSTDCATGGADVPWLAVEPVTGTISADSSLVGGVIFDTSVLTQTGQYNAMLRLKSDDPVNPDVYLPVGLTVIAPTAGVSAAAAPLVKYGDLDTWVVHDVTVTNTGNDLNGDTFDVALSGNAWAAYSVAQVGPLMPGASANVQVWVKVPANVVPGSSDMLTMEVTSQADPTKTASLDLTTVATKYAATLNGDAASSLPGVTVVYTLQLANTGNVTNTFTVTSTGNTWNVSLPVTSFTLGAGESVDVIIQVEIPAGAADGDMDVATIEAVGKGVAVSANVTTTVKYFQLFLPLLGSYLVP